MSLVPEADLAALLRQAPTDGLGAALDAAECLVAALIGAPTLGERTVTEEAVVGRNTLSLELSAGPLTTLLALSVDGEECAEVAAGPWWLRVPGGFQRGARVRVSYEAGWNASNLPAAVRQAVLITAAILHARPDQTVRSERLGDLSRQHERGPGVPPAAALLLAPYRRP